MRSRILSVGLAAALLPGTCSPIEGLLGPAQQGPPFDVVAQPDDGFTVKGLPLLLHEGDPPPDPPPDDEPVDMPPGSEGST